MSVSDLPARRKLEVRVVRLHALMREVEAARKDASEYAAKLLLSEYGLAWGEDYTFTSFQYPQGYHGRIEDVEGFMDPEGVRLRVTVSNGWGKAVFYSPDLPSTLSPAPEVAQ